MRRVRNFTGYLLASALCALAVGSVAGPAAAQPPARTPDVHFEGTPAAAVEAMLTLAGVTAADVVYDLGSGDGRILIAAAKRGARGVGIELDPPLVKQATANAKRAGVSDRVTFREADLFTTDISDATVVTLYLLPSMNLRLHPKFLRELRPGTRIVAYRFGIADWPAEQEVVVEGRSVLRWTVPKL